MPESGVPSILGRLWQRGTAGWTGRWTLPLDGDTRTVSVVLRTGLAGNRLTFAVDGQTVDTSLVFAYIGELRRFAWRGHTFALRVKGFGMSGEFALAVDGVEAAPDGVPAAPAATAAPAPAAESAPAPSEPRFLRECNVVEADELMAVEDYPLDNAFGDLALTTDRQISKASTNECSVDTTRQINASLSGEILSLIKAEITGQLSKQIGAKVGETVTESQTLHLSVGAHAAVLYRVLWKRKVRAGERVYSVGDAEITIPYRMTYGLSCEVRSQGLTPQS